MATTLDSTKAKMKRLKTQADALIERDSAKHWRRFMT